MITCAAMTAETLPDAARLLGSFLGDDDHYRAASAAYGDGGEVALERALRLFIARPELGFVWLAWLADATPPRAVGACVVCYAISTSRGGIVAKLDDVTVARGQTGQGIGAAMVRALARELEQSGVSRIDTSCHRDNQRARRFYARLGFRALEEERLALLIGPGTRQPQGDVAA